MQLHTYSPTHPTWYSDSCMTSAWILQQFESAALESIIVWTSEPSLLQEFLCIASMCSSYPVHFKMLAHSWVIQAWVCPMITTLNLVKAMSAEPLVSCHSPVFLPSPRSSLLPLFFILYKVANLFLCQVNDVASSPNIYVLIPLGYTSSS